MREVLPCLQKSSPPRAGEEARDVCRPGTGEDTGWSRPSCRWWDDSGGPRDERSYQIPVNSYVPRMGSCSWDWDCLHRECRAGFQAGAEPGAGSVCPGTGRAPSSRRVEEVGTWRTCRWSRGSCGGSRGVLAPGAPACVSTFWEMSPCAVIPAALHRYFLAGLVWLWL